jgi:dimeric dUTPase (all-alpha-NTP-PPase superfamily)
MEDTFYLRKIALLVEIGEVANELKSFKYWKKDKKIDLEKIQEELIDCLHFFLSLANCSQISFDKYFSPKIEKGLNVNKLLLTVFKITVRLNWPKEGKARESEKIYYHYYRWLSIFERLCQQIDFNEKKLLEVYNRKNKINHQRQLENY